MSDISAVFNLICSRAEAGATGMSSNSWAGDNEWNPWLISAATSFTILAVVQLVADFGATTHAILWTRGAPHACCGSIPALVLLRCHLDLSCLAGMCRLRTSWDLWTEREEEKITSATWKPRKRHWKIQSYKLNPHLPPGTLCLIYNWNICPLNSSAMPLRKKSNENIWGHCKSQWAPGNKHVCILGLCGSCDTLLDVGKIVKF